MTDTTDNLKAMGDKLLGEANALHEQIPVLVRQARKLEYEAFAYYARAEALVMAANLAKDTALPTEEPIP